MSPLCTSKPSEKSTSFTCALDFYICGLVFSHRKSADDRSPPQHLLGDTHISETLLGLTFHISPEAFFQINKDAAEILYNAAIELAKPTKDTTVVDVCCGTGTIGLCFAKVCIWFLQARLIGCVKCCFSSLIGLLELFCLI